MYYLKNNKLFTSNIHKTFIKKYFTKTYIGIVIKFIKRKCNVSVMYVGALILRPRGPGGRRSLVDVGRLVPE